MIEGQTIFRISKNKDNPYVMLDKRFLHNTSLSFKAKGILAYLLSCPDDWEVRIDNLISMSMDGEKAVRSGIDELIEAHYIVRYQDRGESGKFSTTVYEVHEYPDIDVSTGSTTSYVASPDCILPLPTRPPSPTVSPKTACRKTERRETACRKGSSTNNKDLTTSSHVNKLTNESTSLPVDMLTSRLLNHNAKLINNPFEEGVVGGETLVFPESLDTPQFRGKWDEWKAYRKVIRKPLTVISVKKQLKFLSSLSPRDAIESIEQSMRNGWQGLFEPKRAGTKPRRGAQFVENEHTPEELIKMMEEL